MPRDGLLAQEERLGNLMQLEGPILDLQQATYVLDTLIEFEFEAGRMKHEDGPFILYLNNSQRDGIAYMALHVRNLAFEISTSFHAALDGEESVQ